MGKTCVICGKPSGMYPLCLEHLQMKKEGKVIKCEKCGTWHLTNEVCKCENNKENNVIKSEHESVCIICGESTKNGNAFCNDCYKNIKEKMKNINKNEDFFALKDHYYNLKSSIFRIVNKEYVISNLYRLTALAWAMKIYYKNNDLEERVIEDIKSIIKSKKINTIKSENKTEDEMFQNNSTSDEIIEDKINVATANIKANRAIDGHLCLSPQEVSIDDYLYQNEIIHAYNKPVKEIPETERAVVADWFIPISTKGKGKGVYIEYWGIDDDENYEKNKKEKLPLYEKYNVPLIEINKNDIKDTQTLETTLYRKLKENGYPI